MIHAIVVPNRCGGRDRGMGRQMSTTLIEGGGDV
jgi:hypothetical protein